MCSIAITTANVLTLFFFATVLLPALVEWSNSWTDLKELYLWDVNIPVNLTNKMLNKLKILNIQKGKIINFSFLNYMPSLENLVIKASGLSIIPRAPTRLKVLDLGWNNISNTDFLENFT